MKRLTIFESAIIGFFVGVVTAAYTVFMLGTEGYVSSLLRWTALLPISQSIASSEIFTFIFVTIVFVIYGAIIGFLIKKNRKTVFFIIPLVIILAAGIFFEQEQYAPLDTESNVASVISIPLSFPKIPRQYFGTEAAGDLNGDGKDDVAFILPRNWNNGQTLYYLAVALAVPDGHQGTNMLFLGDKVVPQSITIENSIINISYTKGSSTSTSTLYAKVTGTDLEFEPSASP